MFYTISSIAPVCTQLHAEGKTIVLATGFFDLLHAEHAGFLRKANAKGDILIVAVESDERAKVIKGEGRPIETQDIRCNKVKEYADYVITLPSNFNNFEAYDSLMFAVKPDVYAVSSHTDHIKSKTFLVEKYGGHLEVVHDWNPDISTTKLISQNHV